jgi:riboflavin synthase
MFTGLVRAVGRIVSVDPGPSARRLVVDPGALDTATVAIGDSIALAGCCLTVVGIAREGGGVRLAFDASAETLARTTGLDRPGPVNLEPALKLGDVLGGHLVSGHVDGVGTVVAFESVDAPAGAWDAGSRRLVIDAPAELAPMIATKGSIAVDGASLTVNGVDGARFHANLIPHTLAATTLATLARGARVNLEIDLVARHVARWLEAQRGRPGGK